MLLCIVCKRLFDQALAARTPAWFAMCDCRFLSTPGAFLIARLTCPGTFFTLARALERIVDFFSRVSCGVSSFLGVSLLFSSLCACFIFTLTKFLFWPELLVFVFTLTKLLFWDLFSTLIWPPGIFFLKFSPPFTWYVWALIFPHVYFPPRSRHCNRHNRIYLYFFKSMTLIDARLSEKLCDMLGGRTVAPCFGGMLETARRWVLQRLCAWKLHPLTPYPKTRAQAIHHTVWRRKLDCQQIYYPHRYNTKVCRSASRGAPAARYVRWCFIACYCEPLFYTFVLF